MPFPTNPSVGDTYVENDTTYEYLGPVNGWFRKEVGPNNDTTYIGSDGAPGGVSNDTEVIFNDNGSLASDSGFTYNKTSDTLTSGKYTASLGTEALPSVYFGTDTNTGIYSPGEDQVAISINDTERARIDSSGRLLVGASSSTKDYKVVIRNNAGNGGYEGGIFLQRGTTPPSGGGHSLGTITFGAAPTGDENESAKIISKSDGDWGLNDWPSRLEFYTTADASNSPTERMRIDNTGQVIIKAPDNSTTNVFFSLQHDNGTGKVQLDMGGNVRAVNTSGIQAIVSERRLKTNINSIDLDQAWTNAKDIPWRTFEYLDNLGIEYTGHIVDEIEAVDPSLILPTDQMDDQGPIRTYDNAKLNAMRFVALQEALKRIETLEVKVAALEGV